jgi:hypothetical protein
MVLPSFMTNASADFLFGVLSDRPRFAADRFAANAGGGVGSGRDSRWMPAPGTSAASRPMPPISCSCVGALRSPGLPSSTSAPPASMAPPSSLPDSTSTAAPRLRPRPGGPPSGTPRATPRPRARPRFPPRFGAFVMVSSVRESGAGGLDLSCLHLGPCLAGPYRSSSLSASR